LLKRDQIFRLLPYVILQKLFS